MRTDIQTLTVHAFVAATLLALAVPGRTLGLIDPNFTPVHVVKQSALILELKFGAVKDGKATATVQRVLKGKYDGKTLVLTLSTGAFPEHVKMAEKLADNAAGTPGIFFSGPFAAPEGPGGPEGPEGPDEAQNAAKGFLHLGGKWLSFVGGAGGAWELDKLAQSMDTTWNGGTDMLLRAAEYILADPDADVPVKEGVTWAHSGKFAQIDGAVRAVTPVDLAGDGAWALHVACAAGDRLYRYDAKTKQLRDLTGGVKLVARSSVATWGDINADGRLDLLSGDATAVTVHLQQSDGTFQAGPTLPKEALAEGLLGLACVDVGTSGALGVVLATRGQPRLWRTDAPEAVKALGAPPAGADLGTAGPCLLADFDNDGLPDLLQLWTHGGVVYAGKAGGPFAAPVRCEAAIGEGTRAAIVGDFDTDGLLDVFAVCSDGGTHLWNNRGKLTFVDTFEASGELSYKGGSGAVGGAAGDFNNDGRPDVLFVYATGTPLMLFNRGFRSFGLANEATPTEANGLLPGAEEGQQAGTLVDLNGDGVQDVVVVLTNGQAWAFYGEAPDGAARALRAAWSPKAAFRGPVTVRGARGERALAAWNVVPGLAEAFVGVAEAGPVAVTWRRPDATGQEKKALVEDKPVRVVLE